MAELTRWLFFILFSFPFTRGLLLRGTNRLTYSAPRRPAHLRSPPRLSCSLLASDRQALPDVQRLLHPQSTYTTSKRNPTLAGPHNNTHCDEVASAPEPGTPVTHPFFRHCAILGGVFLPRSPSPAFSLFLSPAGVESPSRHLRRAQLHRSGGPSRGKRRFLVRRRHGPLRFCSHQETTTRSPFRGGHRYRLGRAFLKCLGPVSAPCRFCCVGDKCTVLVLSDSCLFQAEFIVNCWRAHALATYTPKEHSETRSPPTCLTASQTSSAPHPEASPT